MERKKYGTNSSILNPKRDGDKEMIKIPNRLKHCQAKLWLEKLRTYCKEWDKGTVKMGSGYCGRCLVMNKQFTCTAHDRIAGRLKYPYNWTDQDIEMILQDRVLRKMGIRK